MTKWICAECSYQIDAEAPPEHCPSCDKDCAFVDVTCYIPECGGEQNVNPQIVEVVRKQQEPKFK